MDSANTAATHIPVRVVNTFDDFTTNCVILESSLAEDLSDPRPHIATLCTWIEWVKNGNGTNDHRLFLWGESIPRIVKSMLHRKYISDPAQTDAVSVFFNEVISIITTEFFNDIENLQMLVCELLDPNKQFYTKYGFRKPTAPLAIGATTQSSTDGQYPEWKDALEVGSCFDALNDIGIWEVVFVEQISPTRTEAEVGWASGKVEWLNLEGNPRVALFGTKTGFADPQPEVEASTTPVPTEPNSPADADSTILNVDGDWRNELAVGYALDCKDGSGTWYQAVVLESREVDKEVKVSMPTEAAADVESQPAMDIQEEQITIQEKQVRVAFIGWPEKYDEWIDVSSDRLALLDTRSLGKRGELAVRKEIKFVVHQAKLTDTEEYAANTQPAFYSRYYVGVVQSFGQLGTFNVISKRLQHQELPLPLIMRLKLFEALGMPYEIYTSVFFRSCFDWFKKLATMTLLTIPATELRNVNRDLLQGALKSLEHMTMASYGRTPESFAVYEQAHLGVARNCLNSPYLNRRLDGLKLLNDFVNRVQNTEHYPSGLKITRNKNSQGSEIGVSYEVVPLAVFITVEKLASWVTDTKILPPLFHGDRAHTSLMERSVKLLKFLAAHNQLHNDIIRTIWEVGDSGEKEALKALQDTIGAMNLDMLVTLFAVVQEKPTLTVEVVDIAAEIGRRTRLLVLQSQEKAPTEWNAANQVHQGVLSMLCSSSDEQAALPENVVSKAANALEELSGFPLGESALDTSKWVGQWLRTVPLLENCVSCLQDGRNVVTSLRILQMLISAWPKGNQTYPDGTYVAKLNITDQSVPFQEGTRSAISSHLEERYGIIRLVAADLLRLKNNFTHSTAEMIAEAVRASATDENGKQINIAATLPAEMQTALNEQVVGNSRFGYLAAMQKRFDFLLFFARSSELLEVPQSIVADIWNHMAVQVTTIKEQEQVFSWFGRIAVKLNKVPGIDNDEDVARVTVCADVTVDWIFTHLLCDAKFIASNFFCDSALVCIDRYFRHMNARSGHIEEAAKTFRIIDTDLEGIGVFWRIVIDAVDDSVALKAAKLITSLPSRLDIKLKPQLPAFRLTILDNCMDKLHSASSSKDTARLVSLLNALLDESAADARGKIRTHGGNSRGASLKLRVNCSGKMHKPEDPFLTMYAQDTGDDLLGAVAATVKLRPSEVKFYCLGKEFSVDDRKRTLSELRIKNGDAIMVVAKLGSTSSSTQTDSKTDEQVLDVEVPIESLPAVVLSTSNKHFTALFRLLETSSGDACDAVWNVLMRLPTNSQLYNGWLNLDHDMASLLQIPHDQEHDQAKSISPTPSKTDAVSLPKLLYTLQILEGLIQPAETTEELEQLVADRGADTNEPINQSQRLIQDWPSRFVAKGGVNMLCDIFISHPLFTHATSATLDQAVPGVTRRLLFQSVRLLVKILYACIRQGTNVMDHDSRHPAIAMLWEELQHRTAVKHPNSFQQLSSDSHSADIVHPPMIGPTFPPPADGESKEPNGEDATSVVYPATAGTWGWRLELQPADITTLFANLQLGRFLERILELVALFFDIAAALPKWRASTSGSSGVKLQEVNTTILDPLDCLLGMTGVLFLFEPQLAEQFGYFQGQDDLSNWLQYILLSPNRTGTTTTATITNTMSSTSSTSNVAPGEVVGQWLKSSLLFLIRFSETLLGGGAADDGTTGRNVPSLRGRVVDALLRNRIPIGASASLELPKAPAIYLCFKCLRDVIGDGQVPPAEKRFELATCLIDEVTQFGSASFMGVFNEAQEEIVAGNLLLLAKLIEIDSTVFDLVVEHNLQFLLLSKFLGLYFEEASGADSFYASMERPIYCSSDPRQRAVLKVLLMMTERSPQLACDIFGWLKLAYNVTPSAEGWSYKPDTDSRSSVGFVGLRNLGSTCYMNALVQQLYMIPSFRQAVLSVPQLTYIEEEKKDDIVRHLQHMFTHLQLSERRAYRPTGWAYAYKDETGTKPINPSLQQDAQEFFAVLCDRLEFGLRNTAQASITKVAMEGQITNQILKAEVGDADVRESEEPFYCLSLRVEGIADVEKSLQDFVQGETIPDYAWDDAGKERVTILKRQCLSTLPKTLILHLKRFELNFDTFMREKINSEFKFPMKLNMFPYTKQGLAARDRGQIDLYPADDEYNYNLVGIVVHSGSADMGHYYSFIRDRQAHDCWIEFNDSDTRPFSASQIPDECFGGKRPVYELSPTTKQFAASESVSFKSAYMLIYERVDALTTQAETASPSSVTEGFTQEIIHDNRMHRLSSRVYTKAHMLFFTKLLQAMKLGDRLKESQDQEAVNLLQNVCQFVLGPQSRGSNHDPYKAACSELGKIYSQHPVLASGLLKKLSSDSVHIGELVLAPDAKIREGTCALLWEVLQAAAAVDGVKILHDPAIFANGTITALKAQNDSEADAQQQKRQKQESDDREEQPMQLEDDGISKQQDTRVSQVENVERLEADTTSWAAVFMAGLTSDKMFTTVAEQWRRSYQFTILLLKWAKAGWFHRHFLIRREVILQICDLFIGDSSPACNTLYVKGARKRAPASYVTVSAAMLGKTPESEWQPRPLVNTGSSASTLQTTPDWTALIEVLSWLVRSCKSQSMIDMKGIPDTLLDSEESAPDLDEWSARCLKNKTLYSTALKQARYSPSILNVVRHLCHEYVAFSNDAADVLGDALSATNTESTAHIFDAIDQLLSIPDSLSRHRALRLFTGRNSILSTLRAQSEVTQKFVCVCLKSIVALIRRHSVMELVLRSDELLIWAPWALKFSYTFREKSVQEDEKAATAASVYSSVTGDTMGNDEYQKGPKVIVFGETNDERELKWSERATRLFDSLRAVISGLGGDPDALIPAEAFVEAPSAPEAVPMSQDQLDDEAFARELQQMEDSNLLDAALD